MERPPEHGRLSWGFARLVVAARWWVIGFWVAAALVSLLVLPNFGDDSGSGGGLKGILSGDTPAVSAERRSVELFGFPLIARTVVVQREAGGLSPYAQARTVVRAVAVDRGKAGDVRPLLGALPVTNTAGLFPGSTESSTTALTYLIFGEHATLGDRTRGARSYAARFFGPRDHVVGVTGSAPARALQGDIIRASLPRVELATLLAIMAIVAISFRSLVAPLLTVVTAGVAYAVTLRVSGALSQLFDLPTPEELKPVVVALLLGVVTDYVVFFCAAQRDGEDERAGRRRSGREVATRAIARSAPIVGVAGVAVAAGTATLLAAQSPFFRALGPALAFTIVVGLLVAITLVPALIAVLGGRVFWPSGWRPEAPEERRPPWRLAGHGHPGRVVHAFTDAVVGRRAVAATVLGTIVVALLLAAAPALRLELGTSFVGSLPPGSSVRQTAQSAQSGFAKGILSPTVVLVEGHDVGRRRAALSALGTAIARQPGVAGVLGPGSQPVPVEAHLLVTADDDAARFLVVLDDYPLGASAVDTMDRLQGGLPDLLARSGLDGVRVSVAGDTATAAFLVHQTEHDLLRIAVAAMVVNLLMLLLFLRALLASVLLLVTSLLSLGATIGLMTAVFTWLDPGLGLTFYVPFATAVLLLAFGSDYNIFTVGHVWEAAEGRTVREAVRDTVPSSVRAVRSAGLALAASFGLLAIVPLVPFRQLAFGVALGILVDVLVVRSLLVPSLLVLVGRLGVWPSRRFGGRPG